MFPHKLMQGGSLFLAMATVIAGAAVRANYPQPVQNAVNRLAEELGVLEADVKVVSFERVTWSDSSLGVPQPGEAYLQVLTPGYRVRLSVLNQEYVYHTDMRNHLVRVKAPGVKPKPGTGATPPASALVPPPASKPEPEPAPEANGVPAIACECRRDLADRLGTEADDVTVSRAERVVFRDASLGLPMLGEAAAQVMSRGYVMLLEAGNVEYVYTATDREFRYGGPRDAWSDSALIIDPIPNEPNHNGNLVQVSFMGTHPVSVASRVSSVYPQANGGVLAMRRTARSRQELLYIAPDREGEPMRLAVGFAFGEAVVSSDGSHWVAFARQSPRGVWQLCYGNVGETGDAANYLRLPADGRPSRLYWHAENANVVLRKDDRLVAYELVAAPDGMEFRSVPDFDPPDRMDMVLNRSETLRLDEIEVGGKPALKVVRVRFDGVVTDVATIEDFRLRHAAVAPDKRLVFLSGLRGDAHHAHAVHLVSGELLPADGLPYHARFWLVPPKLPPELE